MATHTAAARALRAGVTPRILRPTPITDTNDIADFLITTDTGNDARRFVRHAVAIGHCWVTIWVQAWRISGEDFMLALVETPHPRNSAETIYRGVELSLHMHARFERRDKSSAAQSILRALGVDF